MEWKPTAAILGTAALLFGGGVIATQPTDFQTADDITAAETAYHDTTGKYLQVLPNNKAPAYEQGTTKEKLGKDLPANYRVDVYETPKGEHGYAVSWQDATGSYSKGYGPEATDWTWSKLSTSTP